MNKPHTWGSIFNNALARGYCHGGAAYLADRWELRKVKEMAMQTRFHDGSWWAYDPQFDSDTGPYSTEEQAQNFIDCDVPNGTGRRSEMRTQRETDLEDEIELLSEQLLASYARVDQLERLRPFIEETWLAHRDKYSEEYNECEIAECCWCEKTREALEGEGK